MINTRQKIKTGFTLIELLVVISIIALLTSVVITSLNTSREKGQDTNKIRSLLEIRTALQMYFSDNGYFPTALSSLTTPKLYIASIDPTIKYSTTDINNSTTCTSNCPSYHLGIALNRTDNKVLTGDKDISVGFSGLSSDCINTGATDKCYDITP